MRMVHSKEYFNNIMELKTQEEAEKFALNFDSVHLCPVIGKNVS